MCLTKKHKYPRFTIFPKTVYKILDAKNDMFITPYIEDLVRIGETHIGKACYKNIVIRAINEITLDEGFIHCYENYTSAIDNAYGFQYIAECKIPAFTFYFIGTEGEIATRKLKYTKIIKSPI